MIKDVDFWERWKAQQIASELDDFQRNLAIMEAMYEHARLLGAFPPAEPLEGIEDKIRLAKVLNGLRST
ncbi:MAG: hypothetical protein ABSB82_05610 [Terriglobia bacterium]|jgi:hypothetical protein